MKTITLDDLKGGVESAPVYLSENGGVSYLVTVELLNHLIEARKLLVEIHQDADSGNLDGVDLDWMVRADKLLLGDDD